MFQCTSDLVTALGVLVPRADQPHGCARVKEELLKEFNLHTVVRLPNGVFSPYTGIATNILCFDRSGATKEVWYYEHPLPEGRKNYTKTQPLQFDEFNPRLAWWNNREEGARAWKVNANELLETGCNLDRKNPRGPIDLEHLPPEQLAEDILEKERIAELIREIMGTQFVVENKTGAGGAIATQDVARSAPDGYTLLNTPVATVANEFLSKTIKYEYGKDITAVAPQAETANILVVSPALGIKSVAELVKLAKEKPGVLQYATAGRGSATHLTSELFNSVAGTQTVAVHYRGGGDTVKDLLSGEVKMMFSSIAPVQDFVRDGRLVGLATTGPKRDPAFPDLPTIAESGYPGFDVRLWSGMTAPAATPKDIIHKLADANKKALESPEIQQALAAQGFAPMLGSAEDFDAFYRAEREKWGKVIKETGMDKD